MEQIFLSPSVSHQLAVHIPYDLFLFVGTFQDPSETTHIEDNDLDKILAEYEMENQK